MVVVELLLVPDCPNAGRARSVLVESLHEVGLRIDVIERVGAYPSPSVLINGADVMTGRPVTEGAHSCRLDLPTVASVAAALRTAMDLEPTAAGEDAYPPRLAVGVTRDRVRTVSDPARQAHRAILSSFAVTGMPPGRSTLDHLVPEYDATAMLTELHEHDVIRLDDSGDVRAAYPFSAVPTAHRVTIDGGPDVYAMCAVDALGIAAMLGRAVRIASMDAADGSPIDVTVTAAGDTTWSPYGAVVFVGATATGGAATADRRCGLMNFFASQESAQRWWDARPDVDGTLLMQHQAHKLGVDIFGRLLTP
jgi:hypothetical protein